MFLTARSKPVNRVRLFTRSFTLTLVLLGLTAGVAWWVQQDARARLQIQTDAHIGTVWLAGVTYGPNHILPCRSRAALWLASHHLPTPGRENSISGRYGGESGSLECWFDYRSSLPRFPQLECRRVGKTAFVDDLGQAYPGFLDIHQHLVGIYLPGYDHAARRLTCTVQWQPRRAASDEILLSRPMAFVVNLPHAARQWPVLEDKLPGSVVQATRQGVRVQVRAARLAWARPVADAAQGQLVFRLNVRGGTIADSNVETERAERLALPTGTIADGTRTNLSSATLIMGSPPRPFHTPRLPPSDTLLHPAPSSARGLRLTLTDPYGFALLPSEGKISPMLSLDGAHSIGDATGTVWIAPVVGGGVGTDSVRLHLDVLPAHAPPSARSIPFDLTIPVALSRKI